LAQKKKKRKKKKGTSVLIRPFVLTEFGDITEIEYSWEENKRVYDCMYIRFLCKTQPVKPESATQPFKRDLLITAFICRIVIYHSKKQLLFVKT
jgi:hypothetical protein